MLWVSAWFGLALTPPCVSLPDFVARESMRPQFMQNSGNSRSRVTGAVQPYQNVKERTARLFCSWAVITTLVGIVVFAVLSQFALRVELDKWEQDGTIEGDTSAIIAAVVSGVQIVLTSHVYHSLARSLTNFENHRVQSAHRASLVAKSCLFQVRECTHARVLCPGSLLNHPRPRVPLSVLDRPSTRMGPSCLLLSGASKLCSVRPTSARTTR